MEQNSESIKRTKLHNLNLRMKGTRCQSGNVVKGFIKNVSSKLSIGSIPTPYQTIINTISHQKAFNSSQPRFQYKDREETTINSEYEILANNQNINVSHSTKGYGPFLSNNQRLINTHSNTPAPGAYKLGRELGMIVKKQSKKKKRRNFLRENRKKMILEQKNNPGPGSYEILQKTKISGFESSFKTKADRDTYIDKKCSPPPGHYTFQIFPEKNKKTQSKSRKDNTYTSVASTRARQLIQQITNKPKRSKQQVPAPGTYQYNLPNLSPLYEQFKNTNNFIQGKINRFGQYQFANQSKPSIGIYQSQSAFHKAQKKRLIESAAFMSETIRQPFKEFEKKLGPNIDPINYSGMERKNCHFNIYLQWN